MGKRYSKTGSECPEKDIGVFRSFLEYILDNSDETSNSNMTQNEDAEQSAVSELQYDIECFTRLNQDSQRIIAAAIREAYKRDKANGTLQPEKYEVVLKSKDD